MSKRTRKHASKDNARSKHNKQRRRDAVNASIVFSGAAVCRSCYMRPCACVTAGAQA